MYQDFFPEGEFIYHKDLRTVPAGVGAVVVINASVSDEKCNTLGIESPVNVEFVNNRIEQLPWVIVFIAGDEDSHYHIDNLRHPNMKVWIQLPKPKLTSMYPGCHSNVPKSHHLVRRVPEGYGRWVKQYPKFPLQPRPIDWSFVGQTVADRHGEWLADLQRLTNHPQPIHHTDAVFLKYENRNAECLDVCHAAPGECTKHTCGRVSWDEYARIQSESKIVICRPENCNPEASRVAESLEMGCIPIVSEKPSGPGAFRDNYDWSNWWEYMLGEPPPFPVLKNRTDLDEVLQQTLREWPQNAIRVANWWADYKQRLCETLKYEIRGMS